MLFGKKEYVNIATPDINKAIEERYSVVEEEGFSLHQEDDEKYNLYEYLLGLGKYVVSQKALKNVDFLFSKKRRVDQADEIIFAITFKGSFNIRVPVELHRKAATKAAKLGLSLNQLVQKALEDKVAV